MEKEMSSKSFILDNIRRNTTERFEMPNLDALEAKALTYPNRVAQFQAVMKQVGGRAVTLNDGETLETVIARQYPQAQRTALATARTINAEALNGRVFQADDVEKPQDLNGTDLAIVDGTFGVCENGAVWVEQHVRNRAVYFLAEALVLIVRREDLVNNMHEAYRRLGTDVPEYGVFISGPSKTADIEQALVLGAHGARDVTVVLVDD